MKFVRKLGLIVLFAVFSSNSIAGVIIGDNEWLQPADFLGLTYNQIGAVCDTNPMGVGSGNCSGILSTGSGPIDLTGFIWASDEQVRGLFETFVGAPVPDSFSEVDSTWAPALLSLFNPTSISSLVGPSLAGLTRSNMGGAVVRQLFDDEAGDLDQIRSFQAGVDFVQPTIGAWFFRPVPTSVPAPAPVLLLGLGLLGLIARRKVKA